ncbi:MAG: hypothetical protein ACYTFQ_00125 [Planctomycetota bacterium]|jgi:hypothetical protein
MSGCNCPHPAEGSSWHMPGMPAVPVAKPVPPPREPGLLKTVLKVLALEIGRKLVAWVIPNAVIFQPPSPEQFAQMMSEDKPAEDPAPPEKTPSRPTHV